jgi:hypothetical protein
VSESGDNGFPWQASIGAGAQRVILVDRGEAVEEALMQLCSAAGWPTDAIAADSDRCLAHHLEFIIGDPCDDCSGSGKYVGLHAVEDCRTCGGVGRVSRSVVQSLP